MCIALTFLAVSFLAASRASSQVPPAAESQSAQAGIEAQQATNLAGALKLAGKNNPVHILYIHGIGATGPGDSIQLQQSICASARKLLGTECIGGVKNGPVRTGRQYAEHGIFARSDETPDGLAKKVADERYMGNPIWPSWDEWHSSAPFVDHYRISLRNGQTILVDELNWWPLVLAVKCKFIMPDETNLAGRLTGKGDDYLNICSRQETNTTGVEVRSFDWIKAGGYTLAELNARPNRAVPINRWAKVSIMDWRFSDAVLGIGPLADGFIVKGLQELLLDCIPDQLDRRSYFITVTHSLGSYLLFSSLALEKSKPAGDADNTSGSQSECSATPPDPSTMQGRFDLLLQHLSAAFFLANQIPLLEMGWLGSTNTRFSAFTRWSEQRRCYLHPPEGATVGKVLAWSDPNDLLTWYLGDDFQRWQTPPGSGIKVENRLVKNATTWNWLWLLENPSLAHDNYDLNSKVIRALLKGD